MELTFTWDSKADNNNGGYDPQFIAVDTDADANSGTFSVYNTCTSDQYAPAPSESASATATVAQQEPYAAIYNITVHSISGTARFLSQGDGKETKSFSDAIMEKLKGWAEGKIDEAGQNQGINGLDFLKPMVTAWLGTNELARNGVEAFSFKATFDVEYSLSDDGKNWGPVKTWTTNWVPVGSAQSQDNGFAVLPNDTAYWTMLRNACDQMKASISNCRRYAKGIYKAFPDYRWIEQDSWFQ